MEKHNSDSIADGGIGLETSSECLIKNNDASMTTKTKKCVFCNKKYNYLTSHYNSVHSNAEVYNARMSNLNSSVFRKNPSKAYRYIQINENYAYCYFCEKRKNVDRNGFYEHIARHTGEYNRKCSQCGIIITANNKKASECLHKKMIIIPLIPMQSNGSIHIFMCTHCNHTQLQEENLQKHIINMHNITLNVSRQYEKVVLAAAYDSRPTKTSKNTSRKNKPSMAEELIEIEKYQNQMQSSDVKIEEGSVDEGSLNFDVTAHRANDKSKYDGPSLVLTLSELGVEECKMGIKIENDSFLTRTSAIVSNDEATIINDNNQEDDDGWEEENYDENILPSNSALTNNPLCDAAEKTNPTINRFEMRKRKKNSDFSMIVCKKEKPNDDNIKENIECVHFSTIQDDTCKEKRIPSVSYICLIGRCEYVRIKTSFWNAMCRVCGKKILDGFYSIPENLLLT